MRVLRVRLLGELSLSWEDHTRIVIPGVSARSLLAYLVAYRRQSHTRDLLAGTFWPDLPEDTARRRLSQALWQIRSGCQLSSVLLTEGAAIQLHPELTVWSDLEEFTRSYALGLSESSHALRHFEACLEHYGGEFLAGYYDDWALTERERLRSAYLDVLTHLTRVCKSQGKYEQALTCAQRLITENAWDEEAHREVMRLYHLLGRSADARTQYETCRRALREDLGVEPSRETQALAVEIAGPAGLTDLSWTPSAARRGLSPLLEHPDRLPLVGRQSELAGMLKQVEAAARGEGGLAILYGEAGVGKTRLLGELARNAGWRGIGVAWGRCYELSGPPAYQPLLEILRAGLPALRENLLEVVWRAELSRLLPELDTGETPPHLEPEKAQHRTLEAIVRGFQAISHAKPCLVILEDAHWMDRDSLAAIRYMLPRLAEMSLSMVISARSEDLSSQQAEALESLENTRLPTRLPLARLDLDETGELIQRALELEQPPAQFSARLYAETGGNPFFLTETLRALMDDGALYRDAGGVWSTPWDELTQDYAELSLPGSVVQSITRRLERLPASSREALGLAAVIGRGVPFDVWRQASGLSEAAVLDIGDQLCAQGMLIGAERGNAAQSGFDYVFAHDQIRRVTYDQLTPPRLRFYHRRIAETLAELAGSETESLAYHWSEAQVWDKAAYYHQLAGERARVVYANTEAVSHYSRAMEAMQRLPGSPDLRRIYDIRLAREKVFDLQGEREAQTRELDALACLADNLDDDRRRAEVALRQARQADLTCDFPQSIAAAGRAVNLARAAQDPTIEIESLMEWGWCLLLQGEHDAARSRFEEALSLARSHSLKRLEADGLHGVGTVGLVTGNYAEGKTFFQHVLEICRQVDIRPREGSTFANLGYIAQAQGDRAASKYYNEQALRLHRETGDQRGAALVMQNASDDYLAEGDFSTAKAYMEQALAIQEAIQARDNIGVTLRGLGTLCHRLGAYGRARDYYERAQTIFVEIGIPYYQGQTLAYLSLLSHHLGDDQAAWEQSQRGLEIARAIDDRLGQGLLLDSLGHSLAGLGRLEQAVEAYRAALALRQALDEPHMAAESRAGLARVALLQGNLTAAADQAEEILRIQKARGFGGANEPARIYLTCYRALDASHDPRAAGVLRTAYELLMAQKANIRDADLERSFLEVVAAHREIVAAYTPSQGVKVIVRLPKKGAPTGRALHTDEWVEARWTPFAPEDDDIADKVARRRHRLQRLLAEAASGEAAPTLDDLAAALQITPGTLKRDLKALRAAGIPAQTRGRRPL